MPSRLREKEAPNGSRPNRSTSRSPKPNAQPRQRSQGRSRTPPPPGDGRRSQTSTPGSRQGSASPVGRRRVLRKGSSVRNPDKAQTSPKTATRRLPKNNSFSGINPKSRKSLPSLSVNEDSTATSNSTKSSRQQPKRKTSIRTPENSKISPAADRVVSEGGRYNNNNRPPVRMNSLGNPAQAKRMNSLGNIGQQPPSRTQPPKRMNSLGSGAISSQIRTQPPTRMNSLSSSHHQPSTRTQPPTRMNSISSTNRDASLIRIRSPSLRKDSKEIKSDPDATEAAANENSVRSASTTSKSASNRKKFKRWGFGGESASDDDNAEQYGESASIDNKSFDESIVSVDNNNNNGGVVGGKVGEIVDSDSDWNSDDSDEAYARTMLMGAKGGDGDGSNLLAPNQKRLESRKRHEANFPNDKWWQKCLRHFRILPPVPNEGRTRKSVRKLIWATLLFDVLVAIVTIATYSGTVTMCCNQVTMASIPTIDWNTFIKVVSYIYLVGIFLEIHPVVREGPIPWNLLNPIFGSLLSFAVFVDDSKAEAIIIWMMEIASVILEGFTYLRLKKLFSREVRRLAKLDDFLKGDQSSSKQHKKGGQYKKNAYLRERRILRIEHAQNKSKLRYHFVGVTVNFVLVMLTLLLMIVVARGRGMCLVAGEGLNLFHPDQRSRCFECAEQSQGWKERCEICEEGPNADPALNDPIQCFYPYF